MLGAPIDAKGEDGYTALHDAAFDGHKEAKLSCYLIKGLIFVATKTECLGWNPSIVLRIMGIK